MPPRFCVISIRCSLQPSYPQWVHLLMLKHRRDDSALSGTDRTSSPITSRSSKLTPIVAARWSPGITRVPSRTTQRESDRPSSTRQPSSSSWRQDPDRPTVAARVTDRSTRVDNVIVLPRPSTVHGAVRHSCRDMAARGGRPPRIYLCYYSYLYIRYCPSMVRRRSHDDEVL